MPETMRPHSDRPGPGPVRSEHLAQPRLGHGLTGRRAAQHHETLRCATTSRTFRTKIRGALGEEHVIDRHDTLLASFADHPYSPQAQVDIDQAQRADLCRSQPAQHHRQHHRPIAASIEIFKERRHILRRQTLRQPLRLADKTTADALTDRDMTQKTVALTTQTRRSTRRRDRIVGPFPDHHHVFEQSPNRGNPAVHRRRRRAPPSQSDHVPRHGALPRLPVQVAEQISRSDDCQSQRPISKEPSKVRKVERIRTNRGRRETPNFKLDKEPVPDHDQFVVALEAMLTQSNDDTNSGHGILLKRVSDTQHETWWITHQTNIGAG